jgi:hypothetical protein
MTIGVGVLASESKKRPDSLILLADTQGSFGGHFSMNRLHKLFVEPRVRVAAVAADNIDDAAEIFTLIRMGLERWPDGTYGNILDALHSAAEIHRRVKFKMEILPKYAYLPNSIPELFTERDLSPTLLRRWKKFYVGCEMLIGVFDKAGQAYIFYLDGMGAVRNNSTPGFAAIGSGAGNAMFWLSYRDHNKSYSPKRSAYHALEAKVMAESSPFVNEKLDMLIASRGKWVFQSDDLPVPPDVPFTISDLREMIEQYGPKSTEEI